METKFCPFKSKEEEVPCSTTCMLSVNRRCLLKKYENIPINHNEEPISLLQYTCPFTERKCSFHCALYSHEHRCCLRHLAYE